MLQIYKNDVVTSSSRNTINISMKELNWYTSNFWMLASQAAVISGFSFSQLVGWDGSNVGPLNGLIFVSLITLTLILEVYVVIVGAIVSVCGKGLGIRGCNGFRSLRLALSVQQRELGRLLVIFVTGLATFVLSSFLSISTTVRRRRVAVHLDLLLLAILLLIIALAFRITIKYYHERENPSTLRAIEAAYNIVGDLDDRAVPTSPRPGPSDLFRHQE